jgi:ubiquinone/menaquinone biosynthesis C-methylase UbiE
MSQVSRNRYEYKAVWTAFAETEQGARAQVIGDVDEDYILEAAEETRRWLEETVAIKSDDVILEIGCGIGRVGQVLAPRCKRWIGCDVSLNMLGFARQRLAAFDNVDFVEISGFDLSPIPSNSVDVVYCTVVFMHLDEWDRYNYILEASRVLRKGGRIFVDNFNLRTEEGWMVFDGQRRIHPQQRPAAISKSSTPQELEVYLRQAGFQDIRIREQATWVQAYAVKPEDGNTEGGLLFELQPQADDVGRLFLAQEHELQQLHAVVAEKNAHIQRLERLLERIENGRVMRLLRWASRT